MTCLTCASRDIEPVSHKLNREELTHEGLLWCLAHAHSEWSDELNAYLYVYEGYLYRMMGAGIVHYLENIGAKCRMGYWSYAGDGMELTFAYEPSSRRAYLLLTESEEVTVQREWSVQWCVSGAFDSNHEGGPV
jgi:hypothetical protein